MKRMKQWLALVLALTMLLLSGCSMMDPTEFQDRYRLMTAVPYEKMEYTRPDVEAVKKALDACCDAAENAKTINQLLTKITEFNSVYYEFATNYSLATIRYHGDTTDTYWAEEYNFCLGHVASLQAGVEDMIRALAASSFRETLESDQYFGPGYFDDYEDASIYDDIMVDIMEQEAQLEGQYLALSAKATETGDRQQILDQYGDQLMDLYIRLVQVRQQMARHAGYDSYSQFAYDTYYKRSYSPIDAQEYLKRTGKELKDLVARFQGLQGLESMNDACSSQEALQYVKNIAANMGGRIQAAYKFMEKSGTYDIAPGANKYGASFQTYLYSYNSPFLFISPSGTQADKLVLAHEFGHYAGSYVAGGNLMGLDVAETQSQAMEYLSLCYGDASDAMAIYKLAEGLEIYLQQGTFALFEHSIYSLPGSALTEQKITSEFRESCRAFGLEELLPDGREFLLVPHLFIEPMYVISYVVSNDVALQIYEKETQTAGAGLAIYKQCLDRHDASLEEMVTACGLTDPMSVFRPDRIRNFYGNMIAKYEAAHQPPMAA